MYTCSRREGRVWWRMGAKTPTAAAADRLPFNLMMGKHKIFTVFTGYVCMCAHRGRELSLTRCLVYLFKHYLTHTTLLFPGMECGEWACGGEEGDLERSLWHKLAGNNHTWWAVGGGELEGCPWIWANTLVNECVNVGVFVCMYLNVFCMYVCMYVCVWCMLVWRWKLWRWKHMAWWGCVCVVCGVCVCVCVWMFDPILCVHAYV